MSAPSPSTVTRLAVAVLVLALCTPAAVTAVTGDGAQIHPGTMVEKPETATIVSVQGFHFEGTADRKKPARLVGIPPTGSVWTYDGPKSSHVWFYDVDPLPNGNLLVVSTRPNATVIEELEPDTRTVVWRERLDIVDTHDVDRLNEHELLVANMRENRDGESYDRIFVYNRTTDEITWEWYFRDHYPADTDRGITANDWSHVNDVDRIDEHRYLVSPRNFDQVIVVNRTTGEIEMRLGEDDVVDTLFEQHNPDFLVSEAGDPTILVADSENDRIVEYTNMDGRWRQTWAVGGFNWPRDADRLPNGNTLVVDTMNHRVVEIAPNGTVVWEYTVPWAPYDAERLGTGDGSNGPAMVDTGDAGIYEVTGGSVDERGPTFSTWVEMTTRDTIVEDPASEFAVRWAHVTPWIRPVWMTDWAFAGLVGALVISLVWGGTEAVVHRQRLLSLAREARHRIARR